MQPCKRIEIVIESPLARRTSQLLDELGVPGYTLIPRASGRGDRGQRRADDPTGTDTNCVFIVVCSEDELVAQIVERMRPLLSRSGGVCVVTDGHWLHH